MDIEIGLVSKEEKVEMERMLQTISMKRVAEVLQILAERELLSLEHPEIGDDEENRGIVKMNVVMLSAASEFISKVSLDQIDQ